MTSVVGHGAIVVLVYGKSTLKEVQGSAKSWRRKSGVLPLCLGLLLRCCAMAADADAGAPGTSRPGGGGCGFALPLPRVRPPPALLPRPRLRVAATGAIASSEVAGAVALLGVGAQ